MMEPHRPYSACSDQAYYSDFSPPQLNGYSSFNQTPTTYYQDSFTAHDSNQHFQEEIKDGILNGNKEENHKDEIEQKNKKIDLKPARKYNKKTDEQKNDPMYWENRKNNNRAVRLCREKTKKQQEKDKIEYEKMKKDLENMKKEMEELKKKARNGSIAINLIDNFKREINASPRGINIDYYPTIKQMFNFRH